MKKMLLINNINILFFCRDWNLHTAFQVCPQWINPAKYESVTGKFIILLPSTTPVPIKTEMNK